MTPIDCKIAQRVRQRRELLGRHQKAVALALAITPSTLYRYEHATTAIPLHRLERLANLYECTIDEFRMPTSAPWAHTPTAAPGTQLGHINCGIDDVAASQAGD